MTYPLIQRPSSFIDPRRYGQVPVPGIMYSTNEPPVVVRPIPQDVPPIEEPSPRFPVRPILDIVKGDEQQPVQIMRPLPPPPPVVESSMLPNRPIPQLPSLEQPISERDRAYKAYMAEKSQTIKDRSKNPLLNILSGIGVRALQAFNNSQGTGARFQDRLFSALGGGIAGGIEGGVTGTVDERFMHDRKLAKLGADLNEAIALEKQNQELQSGAYDNAIKAQRPILDRQKADAEQRKIDVDTANGLTELQKNQLINDPQWQIVKETKVLTPEQAKYFNEKLGTKLSPATWQEIKETEQNGSRFYRPEFSPNYKVNETVPADPTERPVAVTVTTGDGDNKTQRIYPMRPKDALDYDYRSNKDAAAAQAEIEKAERQETVKAATLNFKNEADWREQTGKARNKIPGLEKTVQNLDIQIQEMDAYIQSNAGSDMSDQQRIVTKLKEDRNKYTQELEENRSIASMQKPKSFSLPVRPSKSKNSRRGSYSIGNIQDIINRGNR